MVNKQVVRFIPRCVQRKVGTPFLASAVGPRKGCKRSAARWMKEGGTAEAFKAFAPCWGGGFFYFQPAIDSARKSPDVLVFSSISALISMQLGS